jgi:methylglutaconyl-CoA hydratase
MDPLVLTVPERLDPSGVRGLLDGLEAAMHASVVVLVGGPDRFCLGMDFATAAQGDPRAGLSVFAGLIGALARCPRPTLAVVDGPALGGGLGLAAMCDYVLASDAARFGLPEALYGLTPAIIRPALRTRVSPQVLRMLVLTGYSRDAAQGARLGLCDDVVPRQRLEHARRDVVRQLARARSACVAVLRGWDEPTLSHLLALGVEQTALALRDPEVLAAIGDEDVPWRR